MTSTVLLRIEGGTLGVSPQGLALRPWFTRRSVQIPWSNVMFVSPVPSVRRRGNDWATFRGESLSPDELQGGLRFYAFEVALNDRGAVLSNVSLLMRMWLRASVWLKPLYIDEDVPHPAHGCVKLYFPKRWVQKNGEKLLAALNAIEKHSRFDLLTTVD